MNRRTVLAGTAAAIASPFLAAVPALAKALREDKSEDVRQQAATALGKMIGMTREVGGCSPIDSRHELRLEVQGELVASQVCHDDEAVLTAQDAGRHGLAAKD